MLYSQGRVFKATEQHSGDVVAVKKSRVSLGVKRPVLQHESRVLELLQGHPAIPVIIGYGQLRHFEYMAMELLGESISDLHPGPASTDVKTVVRVVLQIVRPLCSTMLQRISCVTYHIARSATTLAAPRDHSS